MSERQPSRSPETHSVRSEKIASTPENLGREVNERAKNSIENSTERAENARNEIESQAALSKETAGVLAEKSDADTTEVRWWSSELKSQTLDRTLSRVRRRLSKPERSFSKVVHQKTVETVSDATGKTIARPSGILVGSICAFIGSLIAYLVARRVGGELSSSIGLVFFVGGFVLGIVGESLIFLFRKYRLKKSA
jgi:gas vesicle protein